MLSKLLARLEGVTDAGGAHLAGGQGRQQRVRAQRAQPALRAGGWGDGRVGGWVASPCKLHAVLGGTHELTSWRGYSRRRRQRAPRGRMQRPSKCHSAQRRRRSTPATGSGRLRQGRRSAAQQAQRALVRGRRRIEGASLQPNSISAAFAANKRPTTPTLPLPASGLTCGGGVQPAPASQVPQCGRHARHRQLRPCGLRAQPAIEQGLVGMGGGAIGPALSAAAPRQIHR